MSPSADQTPRQPITTAELMETLSKLAPWKLQAINHWLDLWFDGLIPNDAAEMERTLTDAFEVYRVWEKLDCRARLLDCEATH